MSLHLKSGLHLAPHPMARIRRAKAELVRACRSKADDIRVVEAAALHWMTEVEVAYIEHPDTAAAHLAMTAGKGLLKKFRHDLVPLAHKYEARHDQAIVHRIVAAIEGLDHRLEMMDGPAAQSV